VTYSAWVDTHTKFTIHTSHAKGGKARHPHHDYHHDIVNKEILEHELDIPAGDKTWEFSFTLDKETRSTFNGDYGHTKYFVSASVDLPGFDKSENVEFNVNRYRNLNMAKKTLDKVDKSKTETFGLLCCETGPLSLAYNINKTGFVCGEKAKMNIKIDNASGKEVKEVKVVLYQELKYHGVYKPPKPKPKKKLNPGKARKARMAEKRNARKPGFRKKNTIKPLRPERPARPPGEIKKTKTVKHVISSDLVGTAGGNDTKTFDVEFPIPEVPSSHVDTAGIGIGYFIQVEVEADVFLGSVYDKTSVIIGNIPHKAAYREWATENMYEWREEIKESYPDLPNYNGNKYIFYETAKVRDAPEVEDAAEEEEETDSSESDSSDDSSDSDVDE